MSDELQEIKKHCASVDVWEDEIIEYWMVEWLIAEVERLRLSVKGWEADANLYATNSADKEKKIDSLTKELEELKLAFDDRVKVIGMQLEDKKKLEAENAELEEEFKATCVQHGGTIRDLTAQLASAEKARDIYKNGAESHKATTRQNEINWHNEERDHGQTKKKLADSEKENARLKERVEELDNRITEMIAGEDI